jgi:hypothetical protein
MQPNTVLKVEKTIIEIAARDVAARFPKLCDALDIQYYPKPPTLDQFEELIRRKTGRCESKKVIRRAYDIYIEGVA